MLGNVWTQVLSRIETKVDQRTFRTWFQPTALIADQGQKVTIRVPSVLCRDWLAKHYASVISEAAGEVERGGLQIAFVIDDPEGPPAPPEAAAPDAPVPASPAPDAPAAPAGGLNPRYTFSSFVVGPSNQFAHAASVAVAEAPSRSYNPLFLYGGVGLGKTHLMHAIGQYLLERMPRLKLTYISSERFMNEMINAVQHKRVLSFRERYRNVDVLLMDDIQFLAGKEGTQTEFFHTFNSLYDAQKQIVISSDGPPHDIPALAERLRSRFEWGLIVDIQPPDLETKVAILKKKAGAEAVPLPNDVALYIAGRNKSNVRELEGSLIRLIAYASLTGRKIDLSLAQDVLRDTLGGDRAVTIDTLQEFVARHYQLRVSELKSRNSSRAIALPRQVAMYMCKQLTNASLPQIGKSFGGKHHTTVIHSIRTIENRRKNDRAFNDLIAGFVDSFPRSRPS
ncbi:MAG: chromosomal replication initiator protein DnaA [Acidobacteria bacterium]|nr:chromosomal replication initiator protein DnaA [Acidobacteriota bacterium]